MDSNLLFKDKIKDKMKPHIIDKEMTWMTSSIDKRN
jgi:hypothetical protein